MDRMTATGVAGIAFAAALLAGCTGGQQGPGGYQGQGGEEGQVPPAPPAAEQQPPQPQAPPAQDPAAAKAALQQQIDEALKQSPITFEPDSANLTESGNQSAQKIAELAKAAPQELRFTIAGFVANTGTPSPGDQQLSQERAQKVADMFTQAGVPQDRLQVESRGAAQGAQDSDRRVDINVM